MFNFLQLSNLILEVSAKKNNPTRADILGIILGVSFAIMLMLTIKFISKLDVLRAKRQRYKENNKDKWFYDGYYDKNDS